MSKGGDAPDPPDYMALTNRQGQINQDIFNQQLLASRYNAVNPFGSTTWTYSGQTPGQTAPSGQTPNTHITDPFYTGNQTPNVQTQSAPAPTWVPIGKGYWQVPDGTRSGTTNPAPVPAGGGAPSGGGGAQNAPSGFGQWTQTQKFNPLIQSLLDKALSGLNSPFDVSKLPAAYGQEAADAYYNKAARYLDPAWAQQRSLTESRLAEQGFVPGTPAYNNAIESLNMTQDRARGSLADQAVLSGGAEGRAARQQALSELLTRRELPLNEFNSLLTHGQFSPGQGSAPGMQAPDLLGAGQAQFAGQLGQYNAGVGANNAMMNDLLGLGGLFAGGSNSAASGIGGLLGLVLAGL